jgi:hypothetical protein
MVYYALASDIPGADMAKETWKINEIFLQLRRILLYRQCGETMPRSTFFFLISRNIDTWYALLGHGRWFTELKERKQEK